MKISDYTFSKLEKIIDYAFQFSPSDVKLIPVQSISVEDHLAEMCKKCDGYGKTINCPPHIMKPNEFKKILFEFQQAVVFKFDVPVEMLQTDKRHDIAKIVHETSANIEQFAIKNGFIKSKGLAAGSCFPLFCSEYKKCRALTKEKNCRFPNVARPSISGFGINFFELTKVLGWQINKITKNTNPDEISMGMMAGIVLIGE